jgi:hypothetical protein
MMISQPAMLCLEATWQRLLGRAAPQEVLVRLPASPTVPTEAPVNAPRSRIAADVTHGEPETPVRGLVVEKSLPDPHAPLTVPERRARAAALRGLALCRQRRFTGARTAFAEAAHLDPLLDLTRIPTFWRLERAAHEAAIAAYLDVGRERDAAVLRAQVQSTYRPKALPSRPEPLLTP